MDEPKTPAASAPPYVLLAIAACAVLIAVLSFLPWVEFSYEPSGLDNNLPSFSFTLDGTEVSRLRGPDYDQPADIVGQETNPCTCRVDAGDGYITAGLGLILLAVAGAGLFLPAVSKRLVAILTIAAALLAFVVAGYNALGDWEGVGAPSFDAEFANLDGTVQPALWALVAVSIVAAVLGAVMWSLERAAEREEDDFEYDEETSEPEKALTERAEGWA
jgi:hypothetical protein